MVRHQTHNLKIRGSIPLAPTICFPNIFFLENSDVIGDRNIVYDIIFILIMIFYFNLK